MVDGFDVIGPRAQFGGSTISLPAALCKEKLPKVCFINLLRAWRWAGVPDLPRIAGSFFVSFRFMHAHAASAVTSLKCVFNLHFIVASGIGIDDGREIFAEMGDNALLKKSAGF